MGERARELYSRARILMSPSNLSLWTDLFQWKEGTVLDRGDVERIVDNPDYKPRRLSHGQQVAFQLAMERTDDRNQRLTQGYLVTLLHEHGADLSEGRTQRLSRRLERGVTHGNLKYDTLRFGLIDNGASGNDLGVWRMETDYQKEVSLDILREFFTAPLTSRVGY